MYEEIIKAHKPRGWRIVPTKRKDAVADRARATAYTRSIKTLPPDAPDLAECNYDKRRIYCPHVVDAFTLQCLLHEIAHVILRHRDRYTPLARAEYEAERLSFEIMRLHGVRVSRGIRRLSARYINLCITADERKGVAIPARVRHHGEMNV